MVVAVAGSPCGTTRPRPRRTRPQHGAAGPGPGPATLACRVAASGRVVNWYVSRRAASQAPRRWLRPGHAAALSATCRLPGAAESRGQR